MDAGNIRSGHRREIMHIRTEVKVIASSSELGRIAKDGASVIEKWQSQVHGALEGWKQDADSLQQLLESAEKGVKSYLGNVKDRYDEDKQIYENLKTKYENMPPDTSSNLNVFIVDASSLANLEQLVGDLGLPESVIEYAPMGNGGKMTEPQISELYNAVTKGIEDFNFASLLKPISLNLNQLQEQVSQLKGDQTKDMFKVMACFNAVRSNQENVTNALDALTNMVSTAMRAIQG